MANANADHGRSETESRRAITISQGQVTRRRNQFLYLYEGQADRAELIEAKGRFNVASTTEDNRVGASGRFCGFFI